MRVTILNGNPQAADEAFEGFIGSFIQKLESGGCRVQCMDLRDLKIGYCLGCFGCWLENPGECLIDDDGRKVCRAVIQSDLLVLASPISMGFTSALLKRSLDRLIPLVLPHLEVDHDEIHHRKRYEKYPLVGLLLAKDAATDAEDLEIIEQSFRRLVINFKSRLAFTCLTSQTVEEVYDEVNRL